MNAQDVGLMMLDFLGDAENEGAQEFEQVAIVTATADGRVLIRTTETVPDCVYLLAQAIQVELENGDDDED